MQRKKAYRIGFAIASLGGLMVIWINLAVGIIGAPENPANLMYAGVLVVGAIGALLSRFRAKGMAGTMQAMVVVQLLVAGITLVSGMGNPPTPAFSYVLLNMILVAFWAGAGWFFYRAAAE